MEIQGKKALIFAKAITPELGGIETYSERIAHAYSCLGLGVTVISCFRGDHGASRRGSVELINVGTGRQWLVAIQMTAAAMRYRRRPLRPTLIHATTWRVALPALIAFPRVPLIVTIHGREVTEMSRWLGVMMRFVFRKATKALVISDTSLAAAARRVPGLQRKSIVSWNGITASSDDAYRQASQRRSANRVCRVLTICRLVPRKNVEAVLRALATLSEEGCCNWEYSVAGEGPEYERLAALRDRCGLSDKVCLHGRVSDLDIMELYGCSNIFAHPQVSDRKGRDIEGFGLAIADAMAWGLPVIVGKEGAPKEYVSHGVTGFVVDGANVTELATTLKRLIQNQDECSAVGRAARAWAIDNLSWTRHVRRVLEDPDLTDVARPGR